MFKKTISILFLFLACLLYVGHSLFPHNHMDEHHHNGTHHHHGEEHSDENSFSLLFSHFNHTSYTFSTSHLEEIVIVFKIVPNQVAFFESSMPFSKSIGFYTEKEVVRNKEPLIFISPHLLSLQFRGPPTLFS